MMKGLYLQTSRCYTLQRAPRYGDFDMDNDKDIMESAKVKLNFRIPSRMPSLYAHHLFVQPFEEEVVLSFFEVVPPLILPDTEDQMKILQEQGIPADCIARITIAKNRYQSFVEAMNRVLELVKAEQTKEAANLSLNQNKGLMSADEQVSFSDIFRPRITGKQESPDADNSSDN